MKNMTGKNSVQVFLQATVVFLLLCSVEGSAVHQTNSSVPPGVTSITTTFTQGDLPVITLTVTPTQIQYGTRHLAGRDFATLEMNGEGFTTVLGDARLPIISRFIEIPQGAQPHLVVGSVTWEATSLQTYGLPSQIIPAQPSLLKVLGASVEFTMDTTYYSMDSFGPSAFASVSVLGEIRGYATALLQIFPVQYNPMTGDLRIMKQCTLRIDLPGSDMVRTTENINRYDTPSFTPLFNSLFANAGALQGAERNFNKQEGYLIIVGDTLYDAIQPFANWKTALGFATTVTTTSEIPGGVTTDNIKAYIVDAYNNWATPPAYVLLVGDVQQIPTWTGTATGTCTDLYYATIDAGNYFADVVISRFSGSTPEQITSMVDKTIYYEQGDYSNTTWIKKAAFMASNDNYPISEGTHNFVIDTYLTPNNYTCDKLYCHTYHATTQQVTDALDDGRSLAVYSGHGSTTSWVDGPPFTQSNVNALTNDDIYPFVCSHACFTNQFTVGECFGETWLRASHKGAVAFWGATDSSYWDEDDVLEKSMFKAWWTDGIETIGGMTNMGLFYLFEHYGGGGSSQYYFEEYNVLGDSSVRIQNGNSLNTPPNTPDAPTGPATGEIGVECTFTTRTTDPQNDTVSYKVSWGDTVSDWLGLYSSGENVSFTHTWTKVGTYDIRVQAKDSGGLESDWSEASSIIITEAPHIQIGAIIGGVGVSAEIKNVGTTELSNVNWSISLKGGLVPLGRETTGNISELLPNLSTKVTTGFVLGLGSVEILITAGEVHKSATAFIIGPFFFHVQ